MDLSSWTEAQQAVIGSLMIEPETVSGVIFQRCRREHFGDAALRHVFDAARELWESDRPIDPVTVVASAGGNYSELVRQCMLMTPTAANTEAWIDILQGAARLNAMQKAAAEIMAAESEKDAVNAYKQIGEILRGVDDGEDLSAAELIGDYLDRMQDGKDPDYLRWGIEQLDSVIQASAGDFVVLAADSSAGKTALALQFAWHIATTGKRVGFFSLETSRERIEDRLMAEHQVAGIPLPVSKAKKLTGLHFQAAGEAGMRSDRVPFRLIRGKDTVSAIRGKTIQHRFDVIFVDYLQLIDEPGKSRPEIVTAITMKLHRMAQQLGVTVVALSQITPPGKGSSAPPTKDDVRESRQIKQDAEIMMILYPSKEGTGDLRELQVAKNKDGRCPKMMLTFEPEHMSFSYREPPSRSTGGPYRAEGKLRKNRRRSAGEEQTSFEELGEGDDKIPF